FAVIRAASSQGMVRQNRRMKSESGRNHFRQSGIDSRRWWRRHPTGPTSQDRRAVRRPVPVRRNGGEAFDFDFDVDVDFEQETIPMSTSNPFDVIITGAGAGGGTLAHALAATGTRVLLLE